MLAVERSDALSNAATFGSSRVVRELCSSPRLHMYIDQGDLRGITPLMSAAAAGRADCLTVLLEAGADAACCDSLDRTALMFAVSNGMEEEEEERGLEEQEGLSDQDDLPHDQQSADVAAGGHDDNDDERCNRSREHSNRAARRSSGLSSAPTTCMPSCTSEALLLTYGADIRQTALNGWNALHFACAMGRTAAVARLLDHTEQRCIHEWDASAGTAGARSPSCGASLPRLLSFLALRDGLGRTALDLARIAQQHEVIALLEAVLTIASSPSPPSPPPPPDGDAEDAGWPHESIVTKARRASTGLTSTDTVGPNASSTSRRRRRLMGTGDELPLW